MGGARQQQDAGPASERGGGADACMAGRHVGAGAQRRPRCAPRHSTGRPPASTASHSSWQLPQQAQPPQQAQQARCAHRTVQKTAYSTVPMQQVQPNMSKYWPMTDHLSSEGR